MLSGHADSTIEGFSELVNSDTDNSVLILELAIQGFSYSSGRSIEFVIQKNSLTVIS